MDARPKQLALAVAVLLLLTGASYRSQNFIVTARWPELAREVGDAAERYRRDLAIEWLGRELQPWGRPCPIEVTAGPRLGAGGATSFMFRHGQPFGWQMNIQGSRERILDSVLPHEVTHTIFATHYGRPLPRWADEGACTTVEHPQERARQQDFLIQFLSTGRGIPFNRMFAMTEYPHDILPLYAQGHSLAQFLIDQGGRRRFVDFVGHGMNTQDWDKSVSQFYAFRNLSDLQLQWVDWVRRGSPELHEQPPATPMPADAQLVASDEPPMSPPAETPNGPLLIGTATDPVMQLVSVGSGDQRQPGSWYARQRLRGIEATDRLGPAGTSQLEVVPLAEAVQSTARQQDAQQPQAMVLEWDRAVTPPPQPLIYDASQSGTVWR
jgi:hypothetical protein